LNKTTANPVLRIHCGILFLIRHITTIHFSHKIHKIFSCTAANAATTVPRRLSAFVPYAFKKIPTARGLKDIAEVAGEGEQPSVVSDYLLMTNG
jgi:hypothetical protein